MRFFNLYIDKEKPLAGLFLFGAVKQNRTVDLILTMDTLYRLSYDGKRQSLK